MKLEGKVAIVTGGGSGIGAATSKLFAKEGARVVVVDMIEETAKEVASEIERDGGQAVAAKADVAFGDQVDKVVKDTLARWGKIDILFNNAGTGETCWFTDSNESMWDRTIAVNLKGTIQFSHAVLPNMIERKYGKIISTASLAAKIGAGTQVVYSAAKAGVDGFTKALAREVARYGVCVNDICPGPIDTPMFAEVGKAMPGVQKRFIQGIGVRRIGRPEEIAAVALFLASDDSSFVTGHSMVVDGGTSMI